MKTYLVEVHWDVARVYRVEAENPEAAEKATRKKMDEGKISYLDEGYGTTDDNSATVAGEVNENGVRWY